MSSVNIPRQVTGHRKSLLPQAHNILKIVYSMKQDYFSVTPVTLVQQFVEIKICCQILSKQLKDPSYSPSEGNQGIRFFEKEGRKVIKPLGGRL